MANYCLLVWRTFIKLIIFPGEFVQEELLLVVYYDFPKGLAQWELCLLVISCFREISSFTYFHWFLTIFRDGNASFAMESQILGNCRTHAFAFNKCIYHFAPQNPQLFAYSNLSFTDTVLKNKQKPPKHPNLPASRMFSVFFFLDFGITSNVVKVLLETFS